MPATLAPPVPRDRLFGLETEYAFAAVSPAGERMSGHEVLPSLLEEVRKQQPHLPDSGSAGMFLGNSARLYPDCGHPELATPEVRTPGDLVRYVLAGDRILSAAARAVLAATPTVAEIFLARSNVTYGNCAATWGCHESYGHQAASSVVLPGMIPHLVSRIVFTGAGGFHRDSPGIEFLVSPRVAFLSHSESDRSTIDRGIFHSKDEPLNSRGYNRLHVICGEGLSSEMGMWLKAATTVLVLSLLDAGVDAGGDVQLQNPIAAMHAFSSDPEGLATAKRHGRGAPLTAIDIQRHYLAQVEERVDAPWMPEWGSEACQHWRAALDLMEEGPAAGARRFDWAIKLALFRRHARKSGFEWGALTAWNRVAREIHQKLVQLAAASETFTADLSPEMVRPSHPHYEAARSADAVVRAERLDWSAFPAFLQLRNDLWALDARFSQLDTGLFAALDRAGVLDHHAPGVERIDEAIASAPDFGRARIRGEAIRQLAGRTTATCDWEGVWDYSARKFLSLDNPFAESACWSELTEEAPIDPRVALRARQARSCLDMLLSLYDQGRYEEGSAFLETAAQHEAGLDAHGFNDLHRYTGWFQSRRGFLDGNAALQRLYGEMPTSIAALADIICAQRYQGLRPPRSIEVWIERADRVIDGDSTLDVASQTALNSHRAYHLLRRGRPRAAHHWFQRVIASPGFETAHPHVRSRVFADLADTCRTLVQIGRAEQFLDQAEQLQLGNGYEGDLADYTLTYRAKLSADAAAALGFLEQALAIQLRLGNRMGEARTRLLQARLSPDRRVKLESRRRVHSLRRQLPALAECDLTERILTHWRTWSTGGQPRRCTERFWRL